MANKKQTSQRRHYGGHKFDDSVKGRIYCQYGCGCYWSRRGKKGGPIGLHPIQSLCPNNPLNCDRLPGDQDHRIVVEQQYNAFIQHLQENADSRRRNIGKLNSLYVRLLKAGVSEDEIEKILKNSKPI